MLLRDRVARRDIAPWLPIALRQILASETTLVVGIALLTLAIHLVADGGYGYQRDELYDLICGRHLAWGYVDQPPLIALIARFTEMVLGTSLYALRTIPSIAAAGLTILGATIVRMLGGGRFAQATAMIAIALAPFDLAVGSLMTMNAFEPLFWTGTVVLAMLALRADRPPRHLWIGLGAVIGVGLLNKYSMGAFAFALFAGVALTRRRVLFREPAFVFAALLAMAIVMPTLWWQAVHGWPQIELLRNAHARINEVLPPVQFVLAQVLMMNPLAAPLWIAGIGFFLFAKEAVPYRGIGFAYLVLLVVYLALGAKVYYMAPIYTAYIAAGAIVVERALAARNGLRLAYAGGIAALGLVIAPQATPLLPLHAFLSYQHAFDLRGVKMERRATGRVPQNFADMFGWQRLTTQVVRIVHALPPRERAQAAILTGNYGQAAALDVLGANSGLPPVLSGHTNYYIWGTHGVSGALVIAIGVPKDRLLREFGRLERIGTYRDPYVLPDQNNLPIYKCTQPRRPLAEAWPLFKSYI